MFRRLPDSIYDTPAIEMWLEDMARKGRRCVCFYTANTVEFKKAPPEASRFCLEPKMDRPDPPEAELTELYAEAGWAYVDATFNGEFYVWRSTRPDACTVHTDRLTEGVAYERLYRDIRRGRVFSWVVTAAALTLLVWAVTRKNLVLHEVQNASTIWPYTLLLVVWGLWESWINVGALRRLRESLDMGVPLERPDRSRRLRPHRGVITLAGLIWFGVSLFFVFCGGPVYHDPPLDASLPIVSLAELGGEPDMEDDYAVEHFTPLARSYVWARQGKDRRTSEYEHWDWPYETEVYDLRLPLLAGRVMKDLMAEKLPEGEEPEPLDDPRFDGGAYLRSEDGDQYLFLRLGGGVVYARAGVPEDLRDHLDAFAILLSSFGKEEART